MHTSAGAKYEILKLPISPRHATQDKPALQRCRYSLPFRVHVNEVTRMSWHRPYHWSSEASHFWWVRSLIFTYTPTLRSDIFYHLVRSVCQVPRVSQKGEPFSSAGTANRWVLLVFRRHSTLPLSLHANVQEASAVVLYTGSSTFDGQNNKWLASPPSASRFLDLNKRTQFLFQALHPSWWVLELSPRNSRKVERRRSTSVGHQQRSWVVCISDGWPEMMALITIPQEPILL